MNEVQLKHWVADEAERTGLTRGAIYVRMHRGWYPTLKLRRVNKRVVFVQSTARDA